MCSLGIFTCIAQRLSLSVAIVAMVNQTALRQLREDNWNDTNHELGLVGAAVSIIALGFLNYTQPVAAVTVLVITVSMLGVCYASSILSNIVNIAPRFSGIVHGVAATVAFLVDESVPALVGVVTAEQTQAEWRTMFFICAGVYIFGTVFYCIFASVKTGWGLFQRRDLSMLTKPDGWRAFKPPQKEPKFRTPH
ncbi:sialin-like [Aplysia californica]|uniref:Sialin-like n=1 Tax=Aplysia californica TaxID=6500 RepID=A0ABM0JJX0_APLCA|nr:sialin-like [Aplysia californica]